MSITLKQLSEHLNLSISTVSKALRDSYEISADTKRKVIESARALGYSPNPFASALRTRKTKTIALIVPELDNNFFVQAISGAQSVASEKNYHVLVYNTMEDTRKERGILKLLENGRVDGVIISLAGNTNNYDHLKELIRTGTPVVFFDRICPEIETIKITTDDFTGGLEATEHLIGNSCKKIAYLSLSESLSIDSRRKLGYFKALENNGIIVDESLILKCNKEDKATSYEKIKRLLSKENKPDGIFASVEKLALITYHVCKDLRIKIPEELKVICFSNLRTATLLDPPLTTITQPAFEMGCEAASLLLKYLLKRRNNTIPDEHIILNSELVKRGSTSDKLQIN